MYTPYQNRGFVYKGEQISLYECRGPANEYVYI